MSKEFLKALEKNQEAFNLNISGETAEDLSRYYSLVQKHNDLLHLVAPCDAEEFAVRHILESLTLSEFLPQNAKFADVGTGGGLPSIPCLIARQDLKGNLIESKLKKANFLEEISSELSLKNRVLIFNRQFEEIERPDVSFVTCRALDKFTQKLSKLLKWSKNASLLFFGGNSLREELIKNNLEFHQKLMPLSEQRFLFIVNK